jgi:hypothetical protein
LPCDSDHHHFPHQNSHHTNSQQHHSSHQNSDCIPIELCVVCEFCSLFNSLNFERVNLVESLHVSTVDFSEPEQFSDEFFSLFLVRAPPQMS